MSETEPIAQKPTKRQYEVLKYIIEYMGEHPVPPTLRDIQEGLGLSAHSAVASHVSALIALGYLAKKENSARSLVVLKGEDEVLIEPKESSVGEDSSEVHLKWLQKEHDKHPADSKEAAILKAALTLLEQTEG